MKPSKKQIPLITLVLLALGIVFASLILFAPGILESTETDNISDYDLSIDVAYSSKDLDPSYDKNSATVLYLADGASYVEGSGASVNGDVITITDEGTYIARGSLSGGQIVISAGESDKVQLVLDDVAISCSDNPAIYVAQADKVFITLSEGSVNTLEDGSEYVATIDGIEAKATIYASSDLTLNGQGTLIVTGNYLHAISSEDDLVITGGKYVLTAVGDGLHGKNSVKIYDGTITINAGDEGIQSDQTDDEEKGFISIDGGSITIASTGNGIEAITVLRIAGGDINITAGDGSGTSAKGLKADELVLIIGGTITLNCEDDGIHSNIDVTIDGGTLSIASGDDGIYTDENLVINGGSVTITQSYEGLEGSTITISSGQIDITSTDDGMNTDGGDLPQLTINGGVISVFSSSGDGVDSNGDLTINGGKLYVEANDSGNSAIDVGDNSGGGSCVINGGLVVAVGSSSMAEGFDASSEQPSIMYNFDTSAQSGTPVSLTNASGKIILTYTPSLSYNSVIISMPDLIIGSTYTLTIGTTVETITLDETAGSYGSVSSGFDRNSSVGEPEKMIGIV